MLCATWLVKELWGSPDWGHQLARVLLVCKGRACNPNEDDSASWLHCKFKLCSTGVQPLEQLELSCSSTAAMVAHKCHLFGLPMDGLRQALDVRQLVWDTSYVSTEVMQFEVMHIGGWMIGVTGALHKASTALRLASHTATVSQFSREEQGGAEDAEP